jgi:RNA polymerase subunit RPABC4/transcription elongation factor Spt4
MNENIDPRHDEKRSGLRVFGVLIMTIGAIFTAIGVISFFGAFAGGGAPKFFWCAFIGLPLLTFGGAICKFAFMGTIARYSAGEVMPVAKDSIKYMVNENADEIKTVASAIGEGLAGEHRVQEKIAVRCPKCNTVNKDSARFCNECGYSMQKNKTCDNCGELNDPDAKFCDNCGNSM